MSAANSTTTMAAANAVTATIPHVPVYIEDDSIESGSRTVIERVRPNWDADQIRIKLFTDGITNKLIGLFNDLYPEDDGVLVRVYGKNTDQIIDRKTEFENFKFLSHAGYAPAIYATFDNGMVYQYIRGETLTTTTVRFPSVYRLVAKTMAKIHRLDVNGDHGTAKSKLWDKMNQFSNLVPEHFSSPTTELQFQKIFTRGIKGLRVEMETLKTLLENVDSPVVFCHNDLLMGNIILQRDAAAGNQPVNVEFIDYEYAMLNNQAFDIANHFIEFAGVQEPDFSLYPNVELQMDWLTTYLQEYLGEPLLSQSDPRMAILKNQVDMFAIASHLFWTFWALVQTEISEIDFDYLKYAELRFEQYTKTKLVLEN